MHWPSAALPSGASTHAFRLPRFPSPHPQHVPQVRRETLRAPALEASSRPWLQLLAREHVLVAGLLLAALVVRLPYLWDVPRFTDELQEVLWALAIYRGEILPLTAVDSYYGPVWSYLLAGTFWLERFGADLSLLPRLVVTVLAVATVGVTYGVAREIAGRRAAFVAAALMATSGGHIIINSHTARSNSITPLLTAVLVWALLRAVRSGNGWLLVLGGFLFALALQTHISVVGFAPGLALAVLLLRPGFLRTRWLPLTMVGFLVGYSNMLLFNLETGFWSFVHARALQQGYTGGHSIDLAGYLTNLGALLESLSRLASGTIDRAGNPAAILYLAIAGAGLAIMAWRRHPIPLLFCVSAALVLPYFNPRYGPILSGRYIVPLLPFLFLGIAVAIEAAESLLARLLAERSKSIQSRSVVAISAALVLFPLVPLALYYQGVLADERTNRPLFTLSDSLGGAYRSGDLVLVDEGLAQESLTAGGTDLKAMRVLLESDRIPYRVAKLSWQGLEPVMPAQGTVLVVMDVKKADQLRRKVQVAALSPEVESASRSGHEYGVYRLTTRIADPLPAFASDGDDAETSLDVERLTAGDGF